MSEIRKSGIYKVIPDRDDPNTFTIVNTRSGKMHRLNCSTLVILEMYP